MPSIEQAVAAAQNIEERADPIERAPMPHPMPTPVDEISHRDLFLRCPLPPINSSPDNLRQYYRPSIPQTRIVPVGQ